MPANFACWSAARRPFIPFTQPFSHFERSDCEHDALFAWMPTGLAFLPVCQLLILVYILCSRGSARCVADEKK